MPDTTPTPRRRRLLPKILLATVTTVVAGELLARVFRDPTCFGSFRQLRTDMIRRGYPAAADRELGYVPRAGFAGHDNHWRTQVTIDADALRSNGTTAPPGGRPLVAVGDSFTFGDQVDDDQSWPAHLERRLGRRVANGGVFGYSFAQAVLRGERLVQQFGAEWLIVSFIPSDLERNEFSRRYFPVPWFAITDGQLMLQLPQPAVPDSAEERDRAFKDGLGHSALLDAILSVVAPRWWIWEQKEVRVLPRPAGDEVGLLLVDRLAEFGRRHDCRLMLVLQGEQSLPGADAVLARAREAGIPTLDLIAALAAAEQRDPTVRARWFHGHMTDAGNAWAAEQIAAAIAAASR